MGLLSEAVPLRRFEIDSLVRMISNPESHSAQEQMSLAKAAALLLVDSYPMACVTEWPVIAVSMWIGGLVRTISQPALKLR